MRLGGWNRLFVVLAVAHFLFVVAISWVEWPRLDRVYHDFAFYSRLPDDVRRSILNVQILPDNEQEFIREAKTAPKQTLAQMVRAKYPGAYDDLSDQQLEASVKAKFPGVYDDVPTSGGVQVGEMPNGHHLVFRASLPTEARDTAAKAYWEVVQREASDRRKAKLKAAAIWWAAPLAFIYAVGLAIRWIYLGFKGPVN